MSYEHVNLPMGDQGRVRFVADTEYETRGSYALGSDEETKRAEDREILMLEVGDWIVVVALHEQECKCCGTWLHADSLHGIVMDVPKDEDAWRKASEDFLGVIYHDEPKEKQHDTTEIAEWVKWWPEMARLFGHTTVHSIELKVTSVHGGRGVFTYKE